MTAQSSQGTLKRILNVKEIAEFMGMHERTIYRLVNKGKMPGFKLGGKWVFDSNKIDTWITQETDKTILSKIDLGR